MPEFYDAVIRKLEGHGLGTIAYAQDVHYPTEKPMAMFIKNHARYTINLEHNIETINTFAQKQYDDFDHLNDNAAQEFLFNSLEENLCVNLHKVIESEDCFIVVWLRLMDLVVSVSSAHHDKLRETIRKELPRSFAHENIKALCESYKEKADELSRADQFNPILILTMLENLSEVSVTGSFPFQILDKHKEVKQTLDNYAGLPKDEVVKKVHKSQLDYEHILKFATKVYNDLLKDNKWPPVQPPSDSGYQSISNLNLAATGTLTNTVLALIQKKLSNDSGLKGPCFNCGKMGHIARNCPDKAKRQITHATSTDSGTKKINWKRVVPKEGESKTKKVGKRTFHWCAKCNRWSKTHSTATHVRKQDSSVDKLDGTEKATNLMYSPGAWCLSLDQPTCTDVPTDNNPFPFSSVLTVGYFIMTYLFMVFYLVRNDLFRLSTIYCNVGVF